MPSARPGSSWQQRPGLKTWASTSFAALRRPGTLFSQIQISRRGGSRLLTINLFITAALIVAPWTGTLIGDPARAARGGGPVREAITHGWVFVVQVAAVAAFLWVLTRIEAAGVRFFAARRSWRLTKVAAWQVCCHASIGWVFCGLIPLLVLAILYSMVVLFGVAPKGTLDLAPVFPTKIDIAGLVTGGGVLAGFSAGLVIFEALVYVGVRRCRFAANMPENPGA
jgi:hypothetical protein